MDTVVSIATYLVILLLCYGFARLLNLDFTVVVAFTALALAVDNLTRID